MVGMSRREVSIHPIFRIHPSSMNSRFLLPGTPVVTPLLRQVVALVVFGVASAGSVSAADSGSVPNPSSRVPTSWSQRHRDAENTGRADFSIPTSRLGTNFFDVFRWQKRTPGSPEEGGLSSGSMVFFDGVGPAGTDFVVGGYHWPKGVQGMDRQTGKWFWSGNPGGGESIGANTPAFSPNGSTIYVINDATLHPLMAFASTNGPSIFWHNGSDTNWDKLSAFSPKISPDGRIFSQSWDDRPYAGTDSGAAITMTWGGDATLCQCLSRAAIWTSATRTNVLATGRCGEFKAFDAWSGRTAWSVTHGMPTDADPTVDPATGNAYLPVGVSSISIVGVNASGEPLWGPLTKPVFDWRDGVNMPQRAQSAGCLAHDGKTFYFQTVSEVGDGKLYAINTSDGSVKWTYATGSKGWDFLASSPIVTPNGVIIVGNNHGGTYLALHDQGTEARLLDQLVVAAGGTALSTATLSSDGLLYLPARLPWTRTNGDGEVPSQRPENLYNAVDLRAVVPQTIAWTTPTNNAVLQLNQSYPLTAAASSGLPVTFSVVSGPAVIEGNLLRPSGRGSVVIRAEQAGNDQFLPLTLDRVVAVGTPPLVLEEPNPLNVIQGGMLAAQLTFTGTPLPQVRWFKDGTVIPGATNAFLSITNAQPTSSALYHAVVANILGAVTSRVVSLTVNLPGSELALRPRGALNSIGIGYGNSAGAVVRDQYVYCVSGDVNRLRVMDVGDPDAPRQVAQLGLEGSFDIALVGSHALVASRASGLAIVDVSNPLRPVLVRYLRTLGSLVNAIQVEGDIAFVGNEQCLLVLDVSDPANPKVLSQVAGQGTANGVFVRDSIVFQAAFGGGAYAVDVSRLVNPTVSGRFPQTGSYQSAVFDLALRGDAAYLADIRRGLVVVDWRNLGQPIETNRISGSAWGLELVGPYLCMADSGRDTGSMGLRWFDLREPFRPASIGRYQGFGSVDKVVVRGNRMFTLGTRFGIVDLEFDRMAPAIITQPAGGRPVLGGALRLDVAAAGTGPLSYQWFMETQPIAGATNDFLEIRGVAFGDAGSYMVRISNPVGFVDSKPARVEIGKIPQAITWSQPTLEALLPLNLSVPLVATSSSGLPVGFRVRSGPAVVSNGTITATNWGTVTIVAEQEGNASHAPTRLVRNWNLPTLVGEELGQSSGSPSGTGNGVFVTGNLAYVAEGSDGLQVIDVSNPAAPVRVGGFNTIGKAISVQVMGTLAYVADGDAGLQVIDVSNPARPRRLGGLTSGYAYGVQVVGALAYVAVGFDGLQVIDVSNPAAPVRVGRYDTIGQAASVQVMGPLAYVADGAAGLQVIDVSNPAAPVRVGAYYTSDFAYSVQVVGSLAYVAASGAGLQVIDVSDPAAPVPVGGYDTSGSSRLVQVVGNLAYVADGGAGLQVIDVSNPDAPSLLGSLKTSSVAYGVQVVGDRAFVADGRWGLQMLRLSVGKSQRLNFDLSGPVNLTDSPIRLAATASSGLPITYRVVSGPAKVAGALLTLTGEGRVVVRAEQAGDAQFLPAPAVQREITVLAAPTPLRVSEVSIVSGGRLRFRLDGPSAKSAVLQFSPDLRAWIAVSTNTVPVTVEPPPVSDSGPGFYRAVLQ